MFLNVNLNFSETDPSRGSQSPDCVFWRFFVLFFFLRCKNANVCLQLSSWKYSFWQLCNSGGVTAVSYLQADQKWNCVMEDICIHGILQAEASFLCPRSKLSGSRLAVSVGHRGWANVAYRAERPCRGCFVAHGIRSSILLGALGLSQMVHCWHSQDIAFLRGGRLGHCKPFLSWSVPKYKVWKTKVEEEYFYGELTSLLISTFVLSACIAVAACTWFLSVFLFVF